MGDKYEDKNWRTFQTCRSNNYNSKEMGGERNYTSYNTSFETQDIFREESSGACGSECDNERRYGYVYITENLINGKKYIGQHKSEVFNESYKGSGKLLKRAFKKYGWNNFKTEVIEWACCYEELNSLEIKWIEFFNADMSNEFYNISHGGNTPVLIGKNNPFYGRHHSDESIQKIKDNMPDMSGENNPFYGRCHSDESKKKIGEKSSNRSIVTREKISKTLKEWYATHDNPNKGRKATPEEVERNRLSHMAQASKSRKKIKCIELGIVFSCSDEAARYLKYEICVKTKSTDSNLSRRLRSAATSYDKGEDKGTMSYGYHWTFNC